MISKLEVEQPSDFQEQVISKLEVEQSSDFQESENVRTASNSQRAKQRSRRESSNRTSKSNMPVPYARSGQGPNIQAAVYNRQAQYCPGGSGMGGAGRGPMSMGPQSPSAVGQSVSYDNPQLPGYAWPSYASSPNYAALTYPKQYSPSAWPYIGPFYPYPQVPLGWRKVTLEWDDGWWMLDFKD